MDELDEGRYDGLVVDLLDDEHRQRRLVPVQALATRVRDRSAAVVTATPRDQLTKTTTPCDRVVTKTSASVICHKIRSNILCYIIKT